MANKIAYIFTSDEDHKYVTKTGVGSYLGTVTRALAENQPLSPVIWASESPDQNDFLEEKNISTRNLKHIFLGKENNTDLFAEKLQNCVSNEIDALLKMDYSVIVEAADWKGLMADYYQNTFNPDILKLTRLHNCVTAQDEGRFGKIKDLKTYESEARQLYASDALSSITKWVYLNTNRVMYDPPAYIDKGPFVEFAEPVYLPNPANVRDFGTIRNTKEEAAQNLARLANVPVSAENYNILSLGRLEHIKGVEELVGIASEVVKEIPNAHFYFIGPEGGYTIDQVMELTPEHAKDHIHCTGGLKYEELPNIMQAFDVMAALYKIDNQPTVIMETTMQNIPTLALLRSGLVEMLTTPQGYAALTIRNSQNKEDIIQEGAQRLIEHHQNPEKGEKLCKMLQNKLQVTYNEKIIIPDMVDLYGRALLKKQREYAGPVEI